MVELAVVILHMIVIKKLTKFALKFFHRSHGKGGP
jgi:hypothetical protein